MDKYYIYEKDNNKYYGETFENPAYSFDTEEETIQALKQIACENMDSMKPGDIYTFEIHKIESIKKFYISCDIKMEIYDIKNNKYEDIEFTDSDSYLDY